jgi:general secretion pathway protein G
MAPSSFFARRLPHRGFTLVEVAVALGLVAVLAAIALPMFGGWRDRIKIKKAQDDIIAMSIVIDAFLADNGRLPTSLAEVGRGGLLDPWETPYAYLDLMTTKGNGKARKDHSLVPLNTDYDLYSKGPDKASVSPLTAKSSRDDILRANNGRFVGPASSY